MTVARTSSTFVWTGRPANQAPTRPRTSRGFNVGRTSARRNANHRQARGLGQTRGGGQADGYNDGTSHVQRPADLRSTGPGATGGDPFREGATFRFPARADARMDGAGGPGRPDPGPVRAGDVAAQLRALLPDQEPAALGEGDAPARAQELVGGAAPAGQRHPEDDP